MSDIKNKIMSFIFGSAGGLSTGELNSERFRFSNLLPYIACNAPEDEKMSKSEQSKYSYGYLLKDNSIGYVFECSPMVFAGAAFSSLTTLLTLPLPPKTVIQTVLYADPYLEDILGEYAALRLSNPNLNDIYREQVKQLCEFYRKGASDGLWQLSGTPVRSYRLYISIKIPIKIDIAKDHDGFLEETETYNDVINSFKSTLESVYLNPRPMHPNRLLSLLSRIFNPDSDKSDRKWDVTRPLFKQVINAETDIEKLPTSLRIGSTYAKCITPQQLPKMIDHTTINNMIGYFGKAARSSDDDLNQIQCPFILSASFIYENLRTYLETRASQVNIQQAAGTFAQGILLRKQEMFDMKLALADGETYLRTIIQMWLFDKDEKVLSEKVNRVTTMWKKLNIETQKERSFIMPKLFVSALPLGLYGNDYKDLQRDFILPAKSASYLMTVQAGYVGMGTPYMLFLDKRAQLTSLDILDTGANKNFLLTGGTGGGKSFFLNYLVNSYLSTGAKVRIIDVGESYKKLCNITNGQFIKFADSDLVVNFFEGIGDIEDDTSDKGKQEDYASKMAMLTGVIAAMVMKTGEMADSVDITLIETAVREVYKTYRHKSSIDLVAEWLAAMPNQDTRQVDLAKRGYYLSMALRKYCSDGEYGRYFNGKSNVSFTNRLAVMELDGIPEDLRKVVVLAFASIIEDEVYNGDRVVPTIIILDEAWQTLSDNPASSKFVEGMYRKIRKYNGGVGIATQSLSDTNTTTGKIRHIGDVVRMQSNIKFLLPDEGLAVAREQMLLNLSDFEWHYQISKIPQKSLPRYSELYVKSDMSGGIIRLTTDMFTYFVCSSDATDNTFLTYWCKKYLSENKSLNYSEAMRMAILKAVETSEQLGGLSNFKDYVKNEFTHQLTGNT